MTRYYPGSIITFSTVVAVDGILTDAPDIVFKYKITDGSPFDEDSTVVTPTRESTGTYSVTITADKPGTLYSHWNTGSPVGVIEEAPYNIRRSAHYTGTATDYA